MNVKKLISIMVFTFAGVAFTYNSGQSKEIMKLKLGSVQPPTHYFSQTGLSFGSRVAKYTDGKITVDVYPSGQLGGERDVVEGLRLGTVQLYSGSMGVLSQFVAEFIVFELPYLIKDYEHGEKVWTQIMSQMFSAKMEKAGLHLLGFIKSAPRGVHTFKPIMKLADLKGLRIRTMETSIYIDAYKALGVIPTPIPYPELISALQSGVIDGADQGFTGFFSVKAYQITPFFAHIDFVQALSTLIISQQVWKKLPKESKEAIEKAANESIKEQVLRYEDVIKKYEKAARDSRFPFAYTFPDLTEFREAVKPVYSKYENEVGKDIIQKILALK